MQNQKDKIVQLLSKVEWTSKEKQWLLRYLEDTDTAELRSIMQQQFDDEKDHLIDLNQERITTLFQNIQEQIEVEKGKKNVPIIKMWLLGISAAAVIVFIFLSIYFGSQGDKKQEVANTQLNNRPYKKALPPDSSKALLTLADGSTIVLDDVQDGVLARQGGTKVQKLNRKLTYNLMNNETGEILYNTVTTPPGIQYQVELPDGSQVWLNGSSSLHFQASFPGKERRVDVTGETYFEVTKNAAIPFIVKVQDAEVRVLGTHFNVMAYKDEAALKTTLLEGKVEFVSGNLNSILKPGQQSQLQKNGQVKVVSNINVTEVIAWKNGIFDFEGADTESVIRQLSRWYNEDIIYNKKSKEIFYAKIPRSMTLQEVLKALELTGKVRFEMQGKKIMVTR